MQNDGPAVKNFLIQIEDFKIIRYIAQGGFASVYLIQNVKNDQYYAAKVIYNKRESIKSSDKNNLELQIMMDLTHPSIINFQGYSLTDFNKENNTTIIMDYKKNGSLYDIIEKAKNSLADHKYDNTARQIILAGVSRGMMYLHSKRIIHRDLKTGNILLDNDFHPFITDFGLSKSSPNDHLSSQSLICGTLIYMAPETIINGQYDFKTDVFSFGIIMYEIVTELFPYPELKNSQITERQFINKVINEGYRPVFTVPVKKSIKKLIESCWSKDPNDRPNFIEIFKKLTFKSDDKNDDVDDCRLEGVDVDEFDSYIEFITKKDGLGDFSGNQNDEFFSIEDFNSLSLQYQKLAIFKILEKSANKERFIDLNNLLLYLLSLNSLSDDFNYLTIKSNNQKNSFDEKFNKIILNSKAVKKLFINQSFDSNEFINILNKFDETSIEIKYPSKTFKSIYKKINDLKETRKAQIKTSLLITKIEEEDETLQNNKNIDFVIIHSSVTLIIDRFFYECSLLKEITIPDSVISIGNLSFWGCSSLSNVSIPSTVASIGCNAFEGCSSLEEITIPSSVTIINSSSFCRCTSLKKITIPSSVTKIGRNAFRECTSLRQISIPPSVILIGDNAFAGCTKLLEISIPSSMISLGMHLFRNCTSLMKITIPYLVPLIRRYSFEGCSSLEEVTIHSSVVDIEDFAFDGCSSLKEISIPPSVTEIGRSTFSRCSSLTQIILPSSITKIGDSSFWGCFKLKHVFIPSSVCEIGHYAFCGCSSLMQIEVPSSVTSMGAAVFSDCCSLKNVSLPSSLKSIESSTFCGCLSLAKIEIPSSVTSINECAFFGCSSLRKISIPASVAVVGNFAFCDCAILNEISIPSSLTNIGESAFPPNAKIEIFN